MSRNRKRFQVRGLCAVLAICLAAGSARAIDIVPVFRTAESNNPGYDPNGEGLQAIVEAAADYWEDIIEGSGTLTVRYLWSDISDTNDTLAVHTNEGEDVANNKPTFCRIRFDTQFLGVDRDWYFDATPDDHSEYNMVQRLAQDIDTGPGYNGSVPDLLEVSFSGAANGTGPLASRNGPDLYSTALHEMGHGLGMTAVIALTETSDDEYDFDVHLVWGSSMAAAIAPGDRYHLAANEALMVPVSGPGHRRLPSATDIFSIETTAEWGHSNIDLQRQDFMDADGSGNWNSITNWAGYQTPGYRDDAWVRHGGSVELSAGGLARNLTIDADNSVVTGNNRLQVDETVTVGDGTGTAYVSVLAAGGEIEAGTIIINDGSYLRLEDGGLADAGTIVVNDGAYLTLTNGGLVDAGRVEVMVGARLSGTGTVDAATLLRNDAIISSSDSLVLRSGGAEALDLDGSANTGILSAEWGDLTIDGELKNSIFNNQLTIGRTFPSTVGQTVTFTEPWTLGNMADMILKGDTDDPATLAGAMATLYGDFTVTGVARFTADVELGFNCTADVPASDDELHLDGHTTYGGATIIGSGTIIQNGDAAVSEDTIVSVDVFDWDGGETSATTVNGVTFTVNSSVIEPLPDIFSSADNDVPQPFDRGFDGTVSVHAGTLVVNTDATWRMEGQMTLRDGTVQGRDIIVTGALSASQLMVGTNNTIEPAVEFGSGSTVHIGADCTLTFEGGTTYDGAAVTGDGNSKLVQNADILVTDDTTIAAETYDWDGTSGTSDTTIEADVTLTIDALRIEPVTQIIPAAPIAAKAIVDGYDGTVSLAGGSTLEVNTTDPWRMEGTLNMTNGGGIPRVRGSEMVLVGALNVIGPTAYIHAPIDFKSTATVSVPAGSELDLKGVTTFNGGSFTGDGLIEQNGDATVDSATVIDVTTYNMDGTGGVTELTLNAGFTLNVDFLDLGNNTFTGTLHINNPGQLTVNTPAAWTMAGTMYLNDDGQPNQDYVTGSDISITGQVNVTGLAAIGSTIDLSGTIALSDAADYIRLGTGNANTISGGQITGPGTVGADGGSLSGTGTIGADVEFVNSADLLASGGTLTVSGAIDQVGTIGTSSDSAILDVTSPWNTFNAEELRLTSGQVTGGWITNDGVTAGYGRVVSAGFFNNGRVAAKGGKLVLDTTTFPDLDGVDIEDGLLETGGNVLHVPGNFGGEFPFNGELQIGAGGLFRMDNFGLSIDPAPTPGQMIMTGGTYAAPRFIQGSVLTVSTSPSKIDSNSDFLGGSTNTLAADLLLAGTANIAVGASFTGTANLVVTPGATVFIANGALVGVNVVNNGNLILGSSPGIVKIGGDYKQKPLGKLSIELAGADNSDPEHPQYDQLLVGGKVELAGRIDLTSIERFVPDIGDTFVFIRAVDGFSGTFDRVDGVLQPNDEAFAVTYQPSAVNMTVVRPGDCEVDGDVDFGDFTYLAANYGKSGMSWVDGDTDGDGDVDFSDFTYLAANYGRTSGSAPAGSAEAPPAGAVELHVDVSTGEMWLVGNAATLSGYNITSTAGSLVPDADGLAAPFQVYLANEAGDISAASVGVGVLIDGDLTLDAAYDASEPMDLAFSYGVYGQGGSRSGQIVTVPEPATLSLLTLGGLAMLRRRSAAKAATKGLF